MTDYKSADRSRRRFIYLLQRNAPPIRELSARLIFGSNVNDLSVQLPELDRYLAETKDPRVAGKGGEFDHYDYVSSGVLAKPAETSPKFPARK